MKRGTKYRIAIVALGAASSGLMLAGLDAIAGMPFGIAMGFAWFLPELDALHEAKESSHGK